MCRRPDAKRGQIKIGFHFRILRRGERGTARHGMAAQCADGMKIKKKRRKAKGSKTGLASSEQKKCEMVAAAAAAREGPEGYAFLGLRSLLNMIAQPSSSLAAGWKVGSYLCEGLEAKRQLRLG